DRSCQRSQLRRHSRRQVYIPQALEHLLSGEISIDGVVECDGDERESELRVGKQPDRMRNAAQGDLDRYCYLFLNLFRSAAGMQCDDLNLRIRHIRESFNRQRPECRDSARDEQPKEEDQEKRLVQSERDKTSDHSYFPLNPLLSSRAPL